MSSKEKLATLLEWFNNNEIVWDKEALEIKIVDNGFGVFALKDIACSEKPLVQIPKSTILSVQSTSINNVLEDEKIAGSCSLAIAIMYELAQGKESPWYGYLQALPLSEDLPVFWADEEKAWFKGTEMEDAVHNDLADLKDDYESIVVPLIKEYPYIFKEDDFSFDLFCRISTLISSRAFEVDAFHETAMVPFADIFNHRSGDEHVHFVTDFDVCDQCGALEYCEHQYFAYLEQGSDAEADEEDAWSDVDDEEEDDKMSAASEISLKSEDEEEEEEGPLEDLEKLEDDKVNFWEEDKDEDKKDTCDMILERDVKAGEEIFNTYGQHPNIVLLSKYGFCHDNNENDYVSVSQDNLFGASVELVKNDLLSKKKSKMDEEAITEEAIERVQERFEYFLTNEDILCPKPDGGEGDEEGGCCGDGCCGDDHEHGEDDDCCGGDHDHGYSHHQADEGMEEDDEEVEDDHEEGGKSQPYFINVEGLYEDTVMCLLHVVFVNDRTFEKFKSDVGEALMYFENLADQSQNGDKKSRKNTEHLQTKKFVYTVCKLLAEHRRKDYLDDKGEWTPVEKDIEARSKVTNKRHYYALTCRISEKKIIEKSIAYYDSRIKSCVTEAEPKTRKKQKN